MKINARPLSKNLHLIRWVKKMAALCQPDQIHWVDGSQAEYDALCALMVRNEAPLSRSAAMSSLTSSNREARGVASRANCDAASRKRFSAASEIVMGFIDKAAGAQQVE